MQHLQHVDADVPAEVRALRRIQDSVSQNEGLHPQTEAAGSGSRRPEQEVVLLQIRHRAEESGVKVLNLCVLTTD